MKKSIISLVASLTVFSLAMTFSISIQPAQAQTVNCPAGYTCTPIATQPAGCPAGYTCTPVNVSSVASTVPAATNSCYSLPTNLYLGSTGSAVSNLQTWLMNNGFDIPAISSGRTGTGYYGSQTISAIAQYRASQKYQSCFGLQTQTPVSTTTPLVNTYVPPTTFNPIWPTTPNSAPVVSAFNGKAGSMTVGSVNNVTGQYFTGVTSAYINGPGSTYALGVTINSDSSVNLTLPSGVPGGQYSLYLVNSAGTSQSFSVDVAGVIQSTHAPVVSAFNGKAGSMTVGSVNNVTGQYFTGVTSAYINGPGSTYALGVTINSDSSVNLTLPSGVPGGQYSLYLVNSAGTSQSFSVDVAGVIQSTHAPVVSAFNGKAGSMTVGSVNNVTGQYFTGVTSAYINGPGSTYALGVTINSDSSVNLTLPSGVPGGQYSLYLVNSAGTSQSFSVDI